MVELLRGFLVCWFHEEIFPNLCPFDAFGNNIVFLAAINRCFWFWQGDLVAGDGSDRTGVVGFDDGGNKERKISL